MATILESLPSYVNVDGLDVYKVYCSNCQEMGLVVNTLKLCCNGIVTQLELDIPFQSEPWDPRRNGLNLRLFFDAHTPRVVIRNGSLATLGEDTVPARRRRATDGWLYFLHIADDRFYKIGVSADVNRRVRDIRQMYFRRLMLPKNVTPNVYVIHQVFVPDVRLHEKNLHATYGRYRVFGEYYKLPVKRIPEIVRMMDVIKSSAS